MGLGIPQYHRPSPTLTQTCLSSQDQVRVPAHRLGSGNPDMDQTTALHTRSGLAPRGPTLRTSASPNSEYANQDVIAAAPEAHTVTRLGVSCTRRSSVDRAQALSADSDLDHD